MHTENFWVHIFGAGSGCGGAEFLEVALDLADRAVLLALERQSVGFAFGGGHVSVDAQLGRHLERDAFVDFTLRADLAVAGQLAQPLDHLLDQELG